MLWCLFQVFAVLAVLWFIACTILILISDADILTVLWERFGKKPESLAGKVVWVTGASSGIGEQLAYQLTQAGCRVIISARREEQLTRVKDGCLASEKCKTLADDILVLPLDVANFDSHKEAFQRVLDKFGCVDILLNNAGRGMRGKWWEVDLQVDRDILDTNVLGTVSLTQNVLPHMIKRRSGHVVLVSSIVGFLATPRSRSYTGAKHALEGYFGGLRNEMEEHDIDVTIICPGPVKSNFDASCVSSTGKALENVKKQQNMTAERCAQLSCVAIANRMYESWVCINPPLVMCYMQQYFPNFTTWFLRKNSLKILEKTFGKDL